MGVREGRLCNDRRTVGQATLGLLNHCREVEAVDVVGGNIHHTVKQMFGKVTHFGTSVEACLQRGIDLIQVGTVDPKPHILWTLAVSRVPRFGEIHYLTTSKTQEKGVCIRGAKLRNNFESTKKKIVRQPLFSAATSLDYALMATKKAPSLGCFLLSYLDSNQDKLIQSQMCYRYTIGQSVSFSPKAGAKVLTFSILAKKN